MPTENNIPSRTSKSTLSLPLNADGSINWDGMRSSTAERFAELVSNDPIALEKIGLAAGGSPDTPIEGMDIGSGITEENIRAALDAVNTLTGLGFRWMLPHLVKHPLKRTKEGKSVPLTIDPDILQRTFQLTPEQHAELDPKALKIAQRHAGQLPDWLKRNLDVYMLLGMYLKYSSENAQNAIKGQLHRDIDQMNKISAHAKATQKPVDSDAQQIPMGPEPPVIMTPSNGQTVVDRP